jgi:hypothetical protein
MFGFGLCWYGPYQYYWYNLLDYFMPLKSTANFLAKVSSSQRVQETKKASAAVNLTPAEQQRQG